MLGILSTVLTEEPFPSHQSMTLMHLMEPQPTFTGPHDASPLTGKDEAHLNPLARHAPEVSNSRNTPVLLAVLIPLYPIQRKLLARQDRVVLSDTKKSALPYCITLMTLEGWGGILPSSGQRPFHMHRAAS